MPRYTSSIPPIRFHKAKKIAYVTLSGRQVRLGKWDGRKPAPASIVNAHVAACAEWMRNGRNAPPPQRPAVEATEGAPVVDDLLAGFWTWAVEHYGPKGDGTTEAESFRAPMRILRSLYGDARLDSFGVPQMEAVRREMVAKGWVRRSVNRQVGRLRRIFKWGVARGLVSPDALARLAAMEPLRRGAAGTKEGAAVRPVPEADIAAILPFLSRPVRALVVLQLHTGARPGELLRLRPCDIDRAKEPWEHRPDHWKLAHTGRERTIFFGPLAREVLADLMRDRKPGAPLFDPREAVREMKARGAKGARRPNQKPNPRQTDRTVNNTYTPTTYRQAIRVACKRAGVTDFTPYRLRHSCATRMRRLAGLDTAAAVLGHAHGSVVTASTYAEADFETARRAVEAAG